MRRAPQTPGQFCNRQNSQGGVSGEADYKYAPRLRQVCFFNAYCLIL
jgi:hypothetical protein